MEILPINEMLEKSARRYGSNPALRKRTPRGWSEITYARLISRTKRLANDLRKTGHTRSCLIGVIGDNSPEWVIAFVAVQWIGGVVVPLDSRDERSLKLAPYKRIAHFTLRTEAFPKTTTNKIKRYVFEKQDLREY